MNAALHQSYENLSAHPRGFEVEAVQLRSVQLARRAERRARVRRLLAR
jgi:hypothetical protein